MGMSILVASKLNKEKLAVLFFKFKTNHVGFHVGYHVGFHFGLRLI